MCNKCIDVICPMISDKTFLKTWNTLLVLTLDRLVFVWRHKTFALFICQCNSLIAPRIPTINFFFFHFHSVVQRSKPFIIDIQASHLSAFYSLPIQMLGHFSHFLSSHQYCLSTFLSFHKQGFCTHVPIRQGPAPAGQSEPKDNKDTEGPGSEITVHIENEHQGPRE